MYKFVKFNYSNDTCRVIPFKPKRSCKKRPHHLRDDLPCYRGDVERSPGKPITLTQDDLKIVVILDVKKHMKKVGRSNFKLTSSAARGFEWYFLIRRMDLAELFAAGKQLAPPKKNKQRKSRGFE